MKKYLVILLTTILMGAAIYACGRPEGKNIVRIPRPPVDSTPSCDGTPVGNHRQLVCDQTGYLGYVEQECKTDGTWELVKSTCRAPTSQCEQEAVNKVTFVKDILPILGKVPSPEGQPKNCISCHTSIRINEYSEAKRRIDEIIRRINLDELNTQRMPPSPYDPLEFSQRELFLEWKSDGFIEENQCVDEEDRQAINFNLLDDLERDLVTDANKLDARSAENARYIVSDNKHNLGSNEEEKQIYRAGINKAINAISVEEKNPLPCTPVDNIVGACRIDLDSLGLTNTDWQLIIDHADLVIESFTNQGIFLKQLTGSNVPWLTGDQFMEAALNVPEVYYKLVDMPLTLSEYWDKKGVDFADDIRDFQATCGGGFGSPISINKNRLTCFFDSDDGTCAITFDPIDLDGVDLRNLFKNPLIDNFGESQFEFAASETLCTLENGEMEGALWNAVGELQLVAPENIVKNVEDPLADTEIRPIRTCFRCHSSGFIPFRDQVRDHVIANGNLFPRDDVEIVKFLYGEQGALDAQFIAYNDNYRETRKKLKIDTTAPDPINFYTDRFRKDWTINDVCAFIRIPLKECKEEIGQSSVLSAQVGALLTGGVISLNQLIDVFDVFIDELFLGQEPINRQ